MIEPIWITETSVLAFHEDLIARFGGASGVRDLSLLQSALARPLQHFAYAASPDLINLAATLTAGIVRNHPFVDGNKRTGFLAGVIFLELNGFNFNATREAATAAVLALAASEIDEAAYADFLRQSTTPSTPAQTPPPAA
jgi:death-on-curing protein